MELRNIYMVKFSDRKKGLTVDYEFQSSTESYVRLDGAKKHSYKFIGLENRLYKEFIDELLNLGVLNWKKRVHIDDIDLDSWNLVVCGANDFLSVNSKYFDSDYEQLFKLIKKYDLD